MSLEGLDKWITGNHGEDQFKDDEFDRDRDGEEYEGSDEELEAERYLEETRRLDEEAERFLDDGSFKGENR